MSHCFQTLPEGGSPLGALLSTWSARSHSQPMASESQGGWGTGYALWPQVIFCPGKLWKHCHKQYHNHLAELDSKNPLEWQAQWAHGIRFKVEPQRRRLLEESQGKPVLSKLSGPWVGVIWEGDRELRCPHRHTSCPVPSCPPCSQGEAAVLRRHKKSGDKTRQGGPQGSPSMRQMDKHEPQVT